MNMGIVKGSDTYNNKKPRSQWKNRFIFTMYGLFAGAIEQMLESEMDEHLGYEKHSTEGDNRDRKIPAAQFHRAVFA